MYHTITQSFNVNGTEINMNVVKSASKLNGAFITFYRAQRGNHLTNGKEDKDLTTVGLMLLVLTLAMDLLTRIIT